MKNFLTIAMVTLLLSCNNNHIKDEQANLPVLLSDSAHHASCVYLTTDEKNQPLISWCETDTTSQKKYFFFARFDSANERFSNPVSVPIEANAALHEEGMPKIAVKSNGTMLAIYETAAPTKENPWAAFIRYEQSFDGGKTWTKPFYLTSDSVPGRDHSFASSTRLSDGEIGVCWLDESFNHKKFGRPVYFAKTNGDNGFGPMQLIDSVACECCRTAINSDDKGNISIAFRDILGDTIRDVSVATSVDSGRNFSKAVSFSHDHWALNGCPHNGPCIVTAGQNIYTTWFTGGNEQGVYYARMDENHHVINKIHINAKGRFAQLCVLPESEVAIVAYNENMIKNDSLISPVILDKIDGENVSTKTITPKGMHASYPVIMPVAANRVLVAWRGNDKIYYRFINTDSITGAAAKPLKEVAPLKPDFSSVKFALSKDPSCGMSLKMGLSDTAHYKGKIYGFCSDECRNKFLKKPESYVVK